MAFAAPAAAAVGSVLTNPVTWQVVSAAGGLLSSAGSKKQGQQQQAAYDTNAVMYRQQADAAHNAASLNEFKKRKQLAGVIGSQQAIYAARGVSPVSGSPLDVMADDLSNGYLDIAIDNYNYEVSARSYEYQAQLSKYYGENAKSTGNSIGGTSLLKTAADFGFAMTKNKIGSSK